MKAGDAIPIKWATSALYHSHPTYGRIILLNSKLTDKVIAIAEILTNTNIINLLTVSDFSVLNTNILFKVKPVIIPNIYAKTIEVA